MGMEMIGNAGAGSTAEIQSNVYSVAAISTLECNHCIS